MLIALFSFLGIIIGATLQYLFTRFLDERKHRQNLRTQAYTDFLRGVSEAAHLMIQPQAQRERELKARITDSKARICIYGSSHVIARLAEFERLGAIIQTDEQRQSFVRVLTAMRSDSDVSAADLETVMLGKHK